MSVELLMNCRWLLVYLSHWHQPPLHFTSTSTYTQQRLLRLIMVVFYLYSIRIWTYRARTTVNLNIMVLNGADRDCIFHVSHNTSWVSSLAHSLTHSFYLSGLRFLSSVDSRATQFTVIPAKEAIFNIFSTLPFVTSSSSSFAQKVCHRTLHETRITVCVSMRVVSHTQ